MAALAGELRPLPTDERVAIVKGFQNGENLADCLRFLSRRLAELAQERP
jgi:phosphopantothenate synthetase